MNLGSQHPKMFGKKAVKPLKLPPVRNCFTLAMTNKLIGIINSLKVPKIKKILLYETKFLVPNYSCLQNPWLSPPDPPDPRSLCPLSSTGFVEPPPSRTKLLGTPLAANASTYGNFTFVIRTWCKCHSSRSRVTSWHKPRGVAHGFTISSPRN